MIQGVPVRNTKNPNPPKKNKLGIVLGAVAGIWFIFGIISPFQTAKDEAVLKKEIETDAKQDEALQKKRDEIVIKNINAIGKMIADGGGSMQVKDNIIKVRMPSGISEYDAQRMAKVIYDKVGIGIVQIYDDAGLKRAEANMWGVH